LIATQRMNHDLGVVSQMNTVMLPIPTLYNFFSDNISVIDFPCLDIVNAYTNVQISFRLRMLGQWSCPRLKQLDLQPTVSMMRTTFQAPLLPLSYTINKVPNPAKISSRSSLLLPLSECLSPSAAIATFHTLGQLAKLSRPPLLTYASTCD
jgi:hypothetical protein